jgi:ribosome recycling factor
MLESLAEVTEEHRQSQIRHPHNLHDNAKGQPELKSFYEAITQSLKDAKRILIFDRSTRANSAMDYLVDERAQNLPDISKRVVREIVSNTLRRSSY